MRVLSLFDGIACGRVAFDRAGIPVESYTAYEIDENAITVAKHNYPSIEEKGDVFKAKYIEGQYDILVGGSPCTYWSIARSWSDSRETTASGIGWELFSQYVRALREAKPKWFLYENNASMSKEIKECITKELGCYPVMIDSADFSAQHRKRYYWTNIPFDVFYEKSELIFSDIIDTDESKYKYRHFEKYQDTVKISEDGMTLYFDTSRKGNYSQANRCRKPDQKWNTLTSSKDDKNDVWVDEFKSRHITPLEAERLQTLPDNYTDCIPYIKRFKAAGNGWTVDVIAHILKGLKEEENAINMETGK